MVLRVAGEENAAALFLSMPQSERLVNLATTDVL
jgi:hypothetical protein